MGKRSLKSPQLQNTSLSIKSINNSKLCEFQAKPIIESGDAIGLVDPNLNGNFDEVQMQRMVLAATHCITRAARLRPKMSEVQI